MNTWADEPMIDTRTKLKLSTYRQMYAHATARGLTVAEPLSMLADASLVGVAEIVTPTEPTIKRGPKVYLSVEQKEDVANRHLHDGIEQALIAAEYGVSRGYVNKIVNQARQAREAEDLVA